LKANETNKYKSTFIFLLICTRISKQKDYFTKKERRQRYTHTHTHVYIYRQKKDIKQALK
jgi:hypothetical protein